MPEDLKTLLERADAPSMHVDPHAVLAAGRRRHRRRAAAATGLLTAVVAVVAVGASAVHDLGRASTVPASPIPVASAPVSATTTATSAPRVTARVAIRVGHCHVEYVHFDGQTWGLTDAQQFGGGGGAVPKQWPSGRGLMERLSPDRARYTDDAGTVLVFRPVDDPAVLRIEGKLCA